MLPDTAHGHTINLLIIHLQISPARVWFIGSCLKVNCGLLQSVAKQQVKPPVPAWWKCATKDLSWFFLHTCVTYSDNTIIKQLHRKHYHCSTLSLTMHINEGITQQSNISFLTTHFAVLFCLRRAKCVGLYLENMMTPWGTLFLPRLSQLPLISSLSFPDSFSILPMAGDTRQVLLEGKHTTPLQDKKPQFEESHNTGVNPQAKLQPTHLENKVDQASSERNNRMFQRGHRCRTYDF